MSLPCWRAEGVKIGRGAPRPIAVCGDDPDEIAYQIHRWVRNRRLLVSRDFVVVVNMAEDMSSCDVIVAAGGRRVGEFRITS